MTNDRSYRCFWASALCFALLTFGPVWAQNQHEMNQQAAKEYEASDAELNRLWKEVLLNLTPSVKDKLIESQLQWIKYRDSEAEAAAARFEGGSLAPMIYSGSLKRTTNQRIEDLRRWLDDASY
jgi:uncharacterized protein YecT (DUF1311 family)